MLKKHCNIIQNALSSLVDETNLDRLVPCLMKKNVFSQEIVHRILNPSHSLKRQKTDLFVEITKRGPQAFHKLEEALEESSHFELARHLRQMDTEDMSVIRSPSLNSVGSAASSSSAEAVDGNICQGQAGSGERCHRRKRPDSLDHKKSNNSHKSQEPSTKSVDTPDTNSNSPTHSCRINQTEPFVLPNYLDDIRDALKNAQLGPNEIVNLESECRPVNVILAKDWQGAHTNTVPKQYKMDANPRGCVLVVNNINFDDPETFKTRYGAKNDERCVKELFEQCHFIVETHSDLTMNDMREKTRIFARKEELNKADCVVVIFMSHGGEGESEEDTEIMGTDGLGLKTKEIVGYFYNDFCPAMIDKPKLFLFQSCRGLLPDHGVLLGYQTAIDYRTETDGKIMKSGQGADRVRTNSDVFIVHPVPPGRTANRDLYTGTWFIQTVVHVFSKHAWHLDLEDMLKLVDAEIKQRNNLLSKNFQAVVTKSTGWNKKLYFNPGLFREPITGETIRLYNQSNGDVDQGVDVVDDVNNKKNYSRLRHNQDDDNEDTSSCFDSGKCNLF